MENPNSAKALEDIRVLDFGRFIAGPYCGMILADMGAEVIRVERPQGEEDRTFGLTGPHGENMSYASYARNKRAITLDLFVGDESRDVLRDLVEHTDVVLHNYSPAAANAMGLTYENLRSIKADIVYTAVSCYGVDGPYAKRIGFDPIAQALSGAAYLNGFAHDPPLRSQLPWVDYSTALSATIGTLLALRHRDRTGEGQAVDCALLQTAVSFTAPMIAEALVLGRERPRTGNRSVYIGPSDMFRCKDGYVYVSIVLDAMWKRLMKVVGHEELIDDPDFSTDLKRFENRHRVDPLVAEWIERHTVEEVLQAMESARIPCSPCKRTTEVASDPHVTARKMLEYSDLEYAGLESVPISGNPINMTRTPPQIRHRAPRVGEHNDEIYGGLLGYDAEKLTQLRKKSII
ncbi:CaiB/BaiF CoA transferase family protein [Thermodesulfobacteriota bacterium]